MKDEIGEKLAWAHWSYIEKILKTARVNVKELESIKIHYTTAFIHGYKHGVEDTTSNCIKKKN